LAIVWRCFRDSVFSRFDTIQYNDHLLLLILMTQIIESIG